MNVPNYSAKTDLSGYFLPSSQSELLLSRRSEIINAIQKGLILVYIDNLYSLTAQFAIMTIPKLDHPNLSLNQLSKPAEGDGQNIILKIRTDLETWSN